MQKFYQGLEAKLGHLKFAVVIITIFATTMIIGTFLESYYGTQFAGRIIYKHPLFYLLQFLMFLSIFFATMLRLPFKKRLSGFYIIHLGLILLGSGSFITRYSGIDGIINLSPNKATKQIILDQDILEITFAKDKKLVTRELPKTAFKTKLNDYYKRFNFLDFYPYAYLQKSWKKSSLKQLYSSSEFLLFNQMVEQPITLSLHPDAKDFSSSQQLGPLKIHYFPYLILECWKTPGASQIIIWNQESNLCYTPESKRISIQTTKTGKRFLILRKDNAIYPFFPEISPLAIDQSLKTTTLSPFKVFSRKIFESSANLLIFHDHLAFYDKKWNFINLALSKGQQANLPWMKLIIKKIKSTQNEFPVYIPISTIPIQKNGKIIKGNLRALKLKYKNKLYWVTNKKPLKLEDEKETIIIRIGKKAIFLPFELTLTKFKMDKYTGTNDPASYESFIQLFTETGVSNHHVYMNNPLKHDGFTFYQSSYYKNQSTGQYHSTISANIDPGRPIKYLGSLLLVLGALMHYFLQRQKKNNKKNFA